MTPKFTITNATTAALTRIERARGFLEAATLSEDWVRAMGERALVLEAHYTTHIEGTQLTLDQAERLLAGEAVPEANPDDARELLNYRRAFEFVSQYLDSGARITEALVREIHKHLVEGVRGGTATPGQYRRVQNYVVNFATREVAYTPPPADDVPALMKELVGWLNDPGQVHPVLVGGMAQFQLVHIHPFIDGNGRTSRLLSTLCLYRKRAIQPSLTAGLPWRGVVFFLSKESPMGDSRSFEAEAVWRERLARFERVGLTVAEFCRREGVSDPSFYQWRRRLQQGERGARRTGRQARGEAGAEEGQRFLPVHVVGLTWAEIEIPGGIKIRVPAANTEALRTAILSAGDACQAVNPC